MTPLLFRILSPANFSRSRLVTAHSWWIHPFLNPNLRSWSRIITVMESTGSRCNAINFSTHCKPTHWVVSSGYQTGKSSLRSFADNGADIAYYDESQSRFESLVGSPDRIAQSSCPQDISGKEEERLSLVVES